MNLEPNKSWRKKPEMLQFWLAGSITLSWSVELRKFHEKKLWVWEGVHDKDPILAVYCHKLLHGARHVSLCIETLIFPGNLSNLFFQLEVTHIWAGYRINSASGISHPVGDWQHCRRKKDLCSWKHNPIQTVHAYSFAWYMPLGWEKIESCKLYCPQGPQELSWIGKI